jgi:hypothetical protein
MAKSKKSETVKVEDTPVKGKGKKGKATAPKVEVVNGDFKSKHAELPQREVVWSERRVAIITARRELKAVSPETAVTAGVIAARAGIENVKYVKVACDCYRERELHHNAYVKGVRLAGQRELVYYLLPRGKTCTMTPPVKKGEEGTEE